MSSSDYASLMKEYGCPLYLYEEKILATQLELLRSTFPNFSLLYSMKTNPHPAICRFMATNGVGVDAASPFEVTHALQAGVAPQNILYSAPGKTVADLTKALEKCIITADSYNELSRLEALAAEYHLKEPLPVGIRINPDMAFSSGEFPEITGGISAKFSVDEESLPKNKPLFSSLRHIRPAGIHVFLRSQVLSHTSLAKSFGAVFTVAMRCRELFGWDISFINFGGGLGIAPSVNAPGLDTEKLRESVQQLVETYLPSLPGCTLYIESGRFLVGQAGSFITRIEDIKESRGKTYVIAPGCLNAFLRPAVSGLLTGLPFSVQGPFEPLFSSGEAHAVALPEKREGVSRQVTVCGNLCTALDTVARDIMLPDPQIGDILTISNAGAYAATLSPSNFASFPPPKEVYMQENGAIRE